MSSDMFSNSAIAALLAGCLWFESFWLYTASIELMSSLIMPMPVHSVSQLLAFLSSCHSVSSYDIALFFFVLILLENTLRLSVSPTKKFKSE